MSAEPVGTSETSLRVWEAKERGGGECGKLGMLKVWCDKDSVYLEM